MNVEWITFTLKEKNNMVEKNKGKYNNMIVEYDILFSL